MISLVVLATSLAAQKSTCQQYFQQQSDALSAACGIDMNQAQSLDSTAFLELYTARLPTICSQNCNSTFQSIYSEILRHPCLHEEFQTRRGTYRVKDTINYTIPLYAVSCVQSPSNTFCLQEQKPFLTEALRETSNVETMVNKFLEPRFFCTECVQKQLQAVIALPQRQEYQFVQQIAEDVLESQPQLCQLGQQQRPPTNQPTSSQ
jgi:hypothetical protein